MNKKLKASLGVLIMSTTILLANSAFADPAPKLQELKLVNQTDTKFSFMGICRKGGVIQGAGNINPQSGVTYEIGGKDAIGEIAYYDEVHQEVINFKYDYTVPGGNVKIVGGDKYYYYSGMCTLNGTEFIISNK